MIFLLLNLNLRRLFLAQQAQDKEWGVIHFLDLDSRTAPHIIMWKMAWKHMYYMPIMSTKVKKSEE